MSGETPDVSVLSLPGRDEPVRAELYSTERLEEGAQELGRGHRAVHGFRKGRPLLARLKENGRILLDSYRAVAEAIREERTISPAAEWLVDNFHIVEEQLREIREDLPPRFYRELPKLDAGPLEGYPRVYALTAYFVAHTDSRFDPETLRRYVIAYQRSQPLTMGELWAVAITLRLVLIENLRRLAQSIVRRRLSREEADAFADTLLGIRSDPSRSPEALAARLRSFERPPLSVAFAVHLLQRLRERDPDQTPALVWLTKLIESQGLTPDDLVRREHQEQVATHLTVRNVITSMRLISSVDWAEFFESVSLVEEALRAGTRVAEMDFATRDRYRHAVEELSRRCPVSEIEIARRAAERAREARETGAGDPEAQRRSDPGYYLISRGRQGFEKELGYRVPLSQWLRRTYFAAATPGYVGTILVATAAFLALPLVLSAAAGAPGWTLAVLALLALAPASEVAVAIVNRDVTELVGPRRLPKLELADGIPQDLDTLVVVPALLTSEDEVRELAERLEVHYLSNSDPGVRFALLTDWADSSEESAPEDEPLFVAAREAVSELNDRHGRLADGGQRFLFLHRRRLWNPKEGKWIGWERKRGKLHELSRLLRGDEPTTFFPIEESDRATLGRVRYVLTLDADTRLPRGAVRKLVGSIAHPLNRPLLDPVAGRVVDGYAVLQPRITPTLPLSGQGTAYQRIHSGPAGIDPYAAAVSDVYQDLFGEGIYTGKGIYDVDAFEEALRGRIPEDTLLSHDLFEGLFARAGLVTDVELFEQFPAHYEVAAARQHRWARGDWQLLPWLLPAVPDASRRVVPNPIPAIGRWKILDNLRRSLFAPAAFSTLLAGWTLPGVPATVWTVAVLAAFAIPGLFSILVGLVPGRRGISKRSFLRGVGRDLAVGIGQAAFGVAVLAHQAWLMADGIVRTLFRVLISRRRLLEWVPAAQSEAGIDFALGGFYRRMRGAVALAVVAGGAVVLAQGASACSPLRRSLGAVAVDRLESEPSAAGVRRRGSRGAGSKGPPFDRPADVSLLRDVRGHRGQPPSARQLPGRSEADRRPPHVADERRALRAVGRRGARFRLDRNGRDGRAARGDLRRRRSPRALPGPPLQLVRDEDPPAARAALCLDGGQREPRGTPDRARARVLPAPGRARDRPARARGHRRQPGARPRGALRDRGRFPRRRRDATRARGRPAGRRAASLTGGRRAGGLGGTSRRAAGEGGGLRRRRRGARARAGIGAVPGGALLG